MGNQLCAASFHLGNLPPTNENTPPIKDACINLLMGHQFTPAFIPSPPIPLFSHSSYNGCGSFRRLEFISTSSMSGGRVNNLPSSSTKKLRSKPKSPRRKQPQQHTQPGKKSKQRMDIPISEAKTMGEGIQMAKTISDHLHIAEEFIWLPTDDNLQPHLRTQLIHHEKRRRWGSQLLEGLGQSALGSWEENPMELKQKLQQFEGESRIWTDGRLARAIMSVALPMQVDSEREDRINRPEKEGVWIASALKGLHVLSGCIAPTLPQSVSLQEMQTWIDIHRGISMLVQSADILSRRTTLKDAVEVRWAIRGLVMRLQMANITLSKNMSIPLEEDTLVFDFTTPILNARTSNLPFDVLSHCLPWQMSSTSSDNNYFGYPGHDLLPRLLNSIPFNFDVLTTRTGEVVVERRGTAWLAEDNIGALAYSGKLMKPAEVGADVRDIMREMEQFCVDEHRQSQQSSQTIHIESSLNESLPSSTIEFKWDDDTSSNLAYTELGQFLEHDYKQNINLLPTFFDCALCNHYPDSNSACKFHTDPEHGSHWHRTTAVVSCGTSRTFAFRPIPEVSTWSAWDDDVGQTPMNDVNNAPASLQLFPGDVVFMTGSCNDMFHHAVYSSPFDKLGINNSRVSLVFKRALERGGGKKGHGLRGEGRRTRKS